MSFFNEAEANCDEAAAEPTITETVTAAMKLPRKPKEKGQSKEDVKDFPRKEILHDISGEELDIAFDVHNWKSMPNEIFR